MGLNKRARATDIPNADLAPMAVNTLKGNDDGSPAVPQDLSVAEVRAMQGYQRIGIFSAIAWEINGTQRIIVGDGEDAQYATVEGASGALAAIAADAFGWGVPDGTPGNTVIIEDRRTLITERPVLPAGVTWRGSKNSVHFADLSGAVPGVTLGPGASYLGFAMAANPGGGSVPP